MQPVESARCSLGRNHLLLNLVEDSSCVERSKVQKNDIYLWDDYLGKQIFVYTS